MRRFTLDTPNTQTYRLRPAMRSAKLTRALVPALLLCGSATVLLSTEADQTKAELNKLFASFGGNNGDRTIQGFREHGSNAVIYLAGKVRQHDTLFKRASVVIYTNLPSTLAGRIRPPVSLTPDQIKAVKILRDMGPAYTHLEPAVEVLIVALGDWSEKVRVIAQGALGDLGPGASNAVPALIDTVEHTDSRLNAVWALGRIGIEAKAAIPSLQQAMVTGQSRERVYAAEALWRIAPGDVRAVSCLQSALTDTNSQARAEAANAVRGLGTNAQSVLPTLRFTLQDSDSRTRFCAARALVEIGPRDEQAVAMLLEKLANQNAANGFDRLFAAQSLLQLQPPPPEALDFFKHALQDRDERVRRISAWFMAERGMEIPSVVSFLTQQISDSSTDSRSLVLAVKSAGLIGPPAISLRPIIQKLTASKDEELRNVANDALARMQKPPKRDAVLSE